MNIFHVMQVCFLSSAYTGLMKTGRPCRAKDNDFGKQLLALREQRGWSQSQLAEAMGVTQGAVARWEKRSVVMSPEQIVQLAQVLKVSVQELLGEAKVATPEVVPRGRMRRVFVQAGQLPRRQQQKIVEVVEALVSQHTHGPSS